MCHEVYRILDKNPSRVTGSTEIVEGRDDEYFLREVISPIYQVLMKVSVMCSRFQMLSGTCFAVCVQMLPETCFCIC